MESNKRLFPLVAVLFVSLFATSIVFGEVGLGGGRTVVVNKHGVCKKVINNNSLDLFIPTETALEWSVFRTYAPNIQLNGCDIQLIIASNTQNYNIYNSAVAAGWSSGMSVTLTINSGVVVGSISTSQPSLTTGTFPAGTGVTIVNNGSIIGAGGAGGRGGDDYDGWSRPTDFPTNGQTGGSALMSQVPISVTNNGVIAGGGGGGGGGVGDLHDDFYAGGGGGGGGAGYNVGVGGIAGSGGSTSGVTGALLTGGSGGYFCNNYYGEFWPYCSSISGGNGGDLGANGNPGIPTYDTPGGSGGTAGTAVTGNSYITWLAVGIRLGPIN